MSVTKTCPVLLVVEDSPEDFALIQRAMQSSNLIVDLRHCIDGDDALEFLHQGGEYRQAPTPALIILDLNLPGTDGREVLEEMREHPRLAAIPTIVFSNSSNINDVNACYALGANSFIEKPLGPTAFAEVMQQLHSYWLELVRLPAKDVTLTL